MSMFNDISWRSQENKQECELSAQLVSIHAKRFSPKRWSFLGLGSEKKLYSTHESKPQGEWDRVAERSFPLAVCVVGLLMSRGDELRQLAAQLSVLAALEDSIAVGLSRVMGPASPGRGAVPPDIGSPLAPAAPAAAAVPAAAPSPSHEVAASLLRSASLRVASPRTRTRSRSPALLPKRAPTGTAS